MRKITLELPKWCEERHIYVFAGMELAAYKYLGQPMRVKINRCHECGSCCTGLGEVSPDFYTLCPNCGKEHAVFTVINGICIFLGQDGPNKRPCNRGSGRPFACSAGVGLKNVEGCTERFEEVK